MPTPVITIGIKITSIAPLLMHNGQLSDPLNPAAKELTRYTNPGRGQKSDLTHNETTYAEFQGSLYFDDVIGPFIPSDNLSAMFVDAAKTVRPSRKNHMLSSLIMNEDEVPLDYDGPRDREGLFKDGNFLYRVGARMPGMSGRVQRTRPRFGQWALTTSAMLNTELMSLADFERFAQIGGSRIGLGDWRPRYGRFAIEVTQL